MAYLARIADSELAMLLECFGAVLIVGPKWCGKTTTAMQQAKSVLKLQDPDSRANYLVTAGVKPSLLLQGAKPRLLDEWQEAPVLWDAVRMSVDRMHSTGLYILTGSTSVRTDLTHHSGTGRIARLKMSTMSLYESGESTGSISLRALFDDEVCEIDGLTSPLAVEDVIKVACRGGWPATLTQHSEANRLIVAQEYLENICQSDISTVDGRERKPHLTRLLLRAYARNLSTLATKATLRRDMASYGESISAVTLDSYYNALERLFVIEDIEAWSPAVRSASALRAGLKHEFADPSLAVAALGLTPEQLMLDLKTFGFIFECLCIRDLKVYSAAIGGHLSYYRDRYGLEADAVLHLADGRYALIEFKLGSMAIDEGATHLLKLRDLIRAAQEKEHQTALREPTLLMIITAGEIAYTRADGVRVVPLGCLKG